jgi:hypothetical protein
VILVFWGGTKLKKYKNTLQMSGNNSSGAVTHKSVVPNGMQVHSPQHNTGHVTARQLNSVAPALQHSGGGAARTPQLWQKQNRELVVPASVACRCAPPTTLPSSSTHHHRCTLRPPAAAAVAAAALAHHNTLQSLILLSKKDNLLVATGLPSQVTQAKMAAAVPVVVDGSCNVGIGLMKTVRGHEVKNLVKYGPAELSKQILVGDMLFNINERSTVQMSQENVAAVRTCSAHSVPAFSHACARNLWVLLIPRSGSRL